jgi:hypothetical protein
MLGHQFMQKAPGAGLETLGCQAMAVSASSSGAIASNIAANA